jgi:hypothetical protein
MATPAISWPTVEPETLPSLLAGLRSSWVSGLRLFERLGAEL